MERNEIIEALTKIVADCIALDPAQIKPESRLIDDLGVDSLDFVDILFQIDKRFGVTVRNKELNLLSGVDMTTPDAMKHGALTPEVAAKLVEWIPAIKNVEPLELTPRRVFGMISVDTLARVVERKLAEKAAA